MSRLLSAAPILAYGTARPKRRPFIVATAVVVLLLAGLLGWHNLDAIRQRNVNRQNRDEIRHSIESNLRRTELDLSAARWSSAQVSIDRARLATSADPTLFSEKEVASFHRKSDAAQLRLDALQAQDLKQHPERHGPPRGCSFNTINGLCDRAERAMQEGDYDLSSHIAQQIFLLDPSNPRAANLLRQTNEHLASSRPAR